MYKFLVASIGIVLITGCSSTPQVSVERDQYCYTDQTIVNDNGTVNSQTTLECSDNPLKRAKLVGVDEKNCRRWQRQDVVNGRVKTYGGYICRDEKNNWRPLSNF